MVASNDKTHPVFYDAVYVYPVPFGIWLHDKHISRRREADAVANDPQCRRFARTGFIEMTGAITEADDSVVTLKHIRSGLDT